MHEFFSLIVIINACRKSIYKGLSYKNILINNSCISDFLQLVKCAKFSNSSELTSVTATEGFSRSTGWNSSSPHGRVVLVSMFHGTSERKRDSIKVSTVA